LDYDYILHIVYFAILYIAGLIRRTAPFSRLLRQRGCGKPILTWFFNRLVQHAMGCLEPILTRNQTDWSKGRLYEPLESCISKLDCYNHQSNCRMRTLWDFWNSTNINLLISKTSCAYVSYVDQVFTCLRGAQVDCILFNVHLENFSLIWTLHHGRWWAARYICMFSD
jgi:hypothetical protein